MELLKRITIGAVAIAALASLALQAASADPVVKKQGKAELSVSGLVVDLKPIAGQEYRISGNWSVNDTGDIYNGRDVVDEFDIATNTVVAGTWVYTGYFNAGDCNAVVGTEKLDNAWTTDLKLWGQDWKARGGVYAFTSALGRRPAVLLCRTNTDGRSLLIYRFLTQQPETLPQADMLAALNMADAVAQVSRSFSSGRVGDFAPAHRPEVTKVGSAAATRTLNLPMTGLTVTLPDDGYAWLADKDEESGVDILTRYLPSLPEVETEVVLGYDYPCKDMIAAMKGNILPEHTPTNLPPGWIGTPAFDFDSGVELGACYDRPEGSLIFGVFQGSEKRDIGYLRPLMDALVAAKATPPSAQ